MAQPRMAHVAWSPGARSPVGWSTVRLAPAGAGPARPEEGARRGGRRAERLGEAPELSARSPGEVLDAALDLLKRRFLLFVAFASAVALPAQVLNRLVETLNQRILRSREPQPAELFAQVVMSLVAWLAVEAIVVAFVTVVAHGELLGRPVPAREALAGILRRAPALLVAMVVANVAAGLGMFLCFVPGILLYFLWSAAPAALVLEGLGPMAALARSARLVRGGGRRWMAVQAGRLLLVAPIGLSSTALAAPEVSEELRAMLALSEPGFALAQLAFQSLLAGFSTALAAVVLTVFYVDQRVRREAFDLELRLERLRLRHGEGAGARAPRRAR